MKKSFYLATVLLLAVFIANPAKGATQEAPSTPLRVCIIDDRPKISVVVKGAYKIYAMNSDRILMEGRSLRANVTGVKNGLLIGSKEIAATGIAVKSAKTADIFIDGRKFRGGVDIIRKDNLKLNVINNVDLEGYLYGVLYHEVSHRWPMEVLKAQAIAARTFAIYQKKQNKLQPYDLRSDVYSQMYGGKTSEKWATTRAVNLTRAQVLTFNGEILPAYYHATCAGHTEDASNLWNVDLAPLKSVECRFCKKSPHYRWVKDIPLREVEDKLRKNGYKIGRINAVNILSRNISGRIEKLEIKDETGISLIMTAKDFRQTIGPNAVRSTNFEPSVRWGQLILKGLGWGHGVGLCQWGAYGMARQHKKAEEILKYYYPGAEITTMDKLADKI